MFWFIWWHSLPGSQKQKNTDLSSGHLARTGYKFMMSNRGVSFKTPWSNFVVIFCVTIFTMYSVVYFVRVFFFVFHYENFMHYHQIVVKVWWPSRTNFSQQTQNILAEFCDLGHDQKWAGINFVNGNSKILFFEAIIL